MLPLVRRTALLCLELDSRGADTPMSDCVAAKSSMDSVVNAGFGSETSLLRGETNVFELLESAPVNVPVTLLLPM